MKGQDVILCDGGRHFSYKVLPRVVIVGRPNVGKSTLFNRLLGRRRSITSNTSGVTRDSIEETVILRGFPLRLVDTSGFTVFSEKKASRQHIDTLVLEQTYKSIQC
ncbi:50S ribosome-binding GTPase, partial [Treponema pallidum]